jgi:hypothetical protein
MSGKAVEEEHLSLYRGSVRGIWREGSRTEDSRRHVIEGSGKGAVLLTGVHKENRKVFRKGGFGQYVYWAGTCT